MGQDHPGRKVFDVKSTLDKHGATALSALVTAFHVMDKSDRLIPRETNENCATHKEIRVPLNRDGDILDDTYSDWAENLAAAWVEEPYAAFRSEFAVTPLVGVQTMTYVCRETLVAVRCTLMRKSSGLCDLLADFWCYA